MQLNDEVEELLGVRKRGGLANLERDPPLGVEADPGGGFADARRRGVDAPDACGRELARQKQHGLSISAADDQGTFGRRYVQHGGRQRDQRGGGHGPMIASAGPNPII